MASSQPTQSTELDHLASEPPVSDRHGNEVPRAANPAPERQRRVDAHFRAEATYWKQIYHQAGVFEAIHQQRRDAVLALFGKLHLSTDSSLLEIGCGAGLTTVALARRGYVVQAIDTVDAMLDLTRRLAAAAGVGQRVIVSPGDVHSLRFAENSFHLVLAIGVFPWLHSLSAPLQEIVRVLKPGGHVILSADNRWRLNYVLDPRRFPGLASLRWKARHWLERFGPRIAGREEPRARMYSLRELDSFLAAAGLEKLEGRTLGFGPFSFFNCEMLSESFGVRVHNQLQRWADRGLPPFRSTGCQYIVLARKAGLA